MADRKAINKYYPPDWDPSKGSINRYKKSHPLRHRAKRLDEGILVVRFEMPCNIWCLKCDKHIGMGVRYNAEKSKVGNYYTTPIYRFKMKCHLCDNHIILETDPSKFDYSIIEGARKQVVGGVRSLESNPEGAGSSELSSRSAIETSRRVADSMMRLETRLEDKMKSATNEPSLIDLKRWRDLREDSFSMNQLVRSQFRHRRKHLTEARKCDKALLKKCSLRISLVEYATSDRERAKEILRDKTKTDLDRARKRYTQDPNFLSR